MNRTVIVSNRVPGFARDWRETSFKGGLESTLSSAVSDLNCLWFGWNGNVVQEGAVGSATIETINPNLTRLTVPLSEKEYADYYQGFASQSLWPLLHTMREKIRFREDFLRAYVSTNARLAETLEPHLSHQDSVWVHDFHLFSIGAELRKGGFRGPIGFFLHVPFPGNNAISEFPWATDAMGPMRHYDLIGTQTTSDLERLKGFLTPARNDSFMTLPTLGVYPVTVDPRSYLLDTMGPASPAVLKGKGFGEIIILGVDRLDYIKGIPNKLRIVRRMFDLCPDLRGKVTLLQIVQPSSRKSSSYIEENLLVEKLAQELNKDMGTNDWLPVVLEQRHYTQRELTSLFRASQVCAVTSLRDGMNLVAKEYVAARGSNVGSLVLSKYTGAATELRSACVIDPLDIDSSARSLIEQLNTLGDSRSVSNWEEMVRSVHGNSPEQWASRFISDLKKAHVKSLTRELRRTGTGV